MRWFVVVAAIAACGPKAKPAPPPAERAVASIADIAGDWVTDDDMAWSYALAIGPDGKLVASIDRGKLPRCDREGTLTLERERHFALAMTKNTCEPGILHPGPATVEITSFTGDALTIVVTPAGEAAEQRTYRRRPN